ncbi:hypothetical protein L6Q79_10685 [bacterium]|nr:hypothetical protein [bacterium]NUN45994.1 hypothetical protein [bacterium]HMW36765.1 hypothetical protein [bacterium]HMY36009.1 hypothetical protein [bacterium]HMZ05574.1 hypothetical protein [bacterium]
MKTVQGVYRNGKVEALEELKADNNTKLLIIVTDEKISDGVAPELQGVSVLEKIRRRQAADVSTEQQVSSREKLKQVSAKIDGKLPYENIEAASQSLRRYADDHD